MQRNAGQSNARPAQRQPVLSDALPPLSVPEHRTASPTLKAYGRHTLACFPSITLHKPLYHRYFTEREAVPQLAVTTGTVREEEVGERDVRGMRGPNTYVAFLREALEESHLSAHKNSLS